MRAVAADASLSVTADDRAADELKAYNIQD